MSELLSRLEVSAWGGFVAAQGRLFRMIEEDLKRNSGITHAEFEVLLRLMFAPGSRARIQELAAASLLTHSGTSRVVARLVRAGFVARTGAEEDGRGANAVLTKAGKKHFMVAARHHVDLVRREFLSRFTAQELEVMASFWSRLDPQVSPPSGRKAARK